MRIIAAYLLAVLGGKDQPTSGDITKILESVGIKADAAQVDKLINELKGKDLDALIAEGTKKMQAVPSGGGGGGGSAPAAASGGAAAAGGKPAEKEKEKPKEKEKSEESEADMGFSLFD
jgi:large subunit ribosomal protein LP2